MIMAPTISGDFQSEIQCVGIEASPSFVREPEGNGVAVQFIRTSQGKPAVDHELGVAKADIGELSSAA
jgi:hypothetical protein